MKFNFKKISAIATSVLMTGMTIGTAMAAGIRPENIGGQGNIAIVYGASAHASDYTGATSIDSALREYFKTGSGDGSVLPGEDPAYHDEVTLGEDTWSTASVGDLKSPIMNKKLSGLLKEEITWNDGTGDDRYDIYEKINIDGAEILTSLSDEELEGVAMKIESGEFGYQLCIEKTFDPTKVSDGTAENDDSESIILPILGKDYEITKMNKEDGKITVVTSEDVTLNGGESYTYKGKTITFEKSFTENAQISVNGQSKIIKVGRSAKLDGVRVMVEALGHNNDDQSLSSVYLKVGEDLAKDYANGEEFIGEDDEDPTWVWNISIGEKDKSETCIGVEYAKDYDLEKGEGVAYVGEGFVLPNNYAGITLDSLTDVDYQDVKMEFKSIYLFEEDADETTGWKRIGTETGKRQNVILLTAEDEESFQITVEESENKNVYETNKIAYAYDVSGTDTYELYAYLDKDLDYGGVSEYRQLSADLSDETTVTKVQLIVEETILDVGFDKTESDTDGVVHDLVFTNTNDGKDHVLTLGVNEDVTGLGKDTKNTNAGDVRFGPDSLDYTTAENEIMDLWGIILAKGSDVESQVKKDSITLSIPEEQVFAKVSVSLSPKTSASSSGSVGNMIFRDTDTAGYAGKNVVIIGGSCVNSAAAKVLGVASDRGVPGCYADTGLSAGQFLIKKGLLDGKTAIVVAGYEADDTTKAVQFLKERGIQEGKYTSAMFERVN